MRTNSLNTTTYDYGTLDIIFAKAQKLCLLINFIIILMYASTSSKKNIDIFKPESKKIVDQKEFFKAKLFYNYGRSVRP